MNDEELDGALAETGGSEPMNVADDPQPDLDNDPEHDPAGVPEAEEPSPEDPNRFRSDGEVAPLDEAPDGRTPSDSNETSRDSKT